MIAGDVGVDHVAGHLHQRVFEDRDATGSPAEDRAESALGIGRLLCLSEEFRDGLLACFENADAKAAALINEASHLRGFRDADKHEQRVERDGREGVRGHTMDNAGGALCRDDGDAGGEIAAGVAEIDGSDGSAGHG